MSRVISISSTVESSDSRVQLIGCDAPSPLSNNRLLFIDAYRGFLIMCIISHGFGFATLIGYPGLDWLASQMNHGIWDDVTFWDLIQPAFTFIAGVAMPFWLDRQAVVGFPRMLRQVARRSLTLIILGNVITNFHATGKPVFQLINVLCQLGLGYLLCFFLLQFRFRWQVASVIALLCGHTGLYLLFPAANGPFSGPDNIGALIDGVLFGNSFGTYATINVLGNAVTIIAGAWIGEAFKRKQPHRFNWFAATMIGVGCIVAGLALQPAIPMVKRLWTASFTLFSGGFAILMMAWFYWLIDVRSHRVVTFPLVILGLNSLFAYCFCQLLRSWLYSGLEPVS